MDVLLVLNQANLMVPEEIRRGGDHQPITFTSKLSWVVRGKTGWDRLTAIIPVNQAFVSIKLEHELLHKVRRFC